MSGVGVIKSNQAGIFCYGRKLNIIPGKVVTLAKFQAQCCADVIELGLGVSNVTAWNDCSFLLKVGGRDELLIQDEIADMLERVRLPVSVKGKEDVEVVFSNGGLVNVDASTIAIIMQPGGAR